MCFLLVSLVPIRENDFTNQILVEGVLNDVQVTVANTTVAVKKLDTDHKRAKIERWLSPPDPSINHNKALRQRHEGSGSWLLRSENLWEWKAQRNSFLWLRGIPGCGKTILSSTVIENLDSFTSRKPLLYFYFDFNEVDKQTLDGMIRSLVGQLYTQQEDTQHHLDALFFLL